MKLWNSEIKYPKVTQILCKCCGTVFYLCRACYRNQVYCCEKCRKAGYDENHRKAQAKYRQTEKGRIKHREQEKERRDELKGKKSPKGTKQIKSIVKCLCSKIHSTLEALFKIRKKGEEKIEKCQKCGKMGQVVVDFRKSDIRAEEKEEKARRKNEKYQDHEAT